MRGVETWIIKGENFVFATLVFAHFAFATLNFDILLLPSQFLVMYHFCPNQNGNDEFLFCFCPFCCCFGFGFAPQWERIGQKQNVKTWQKQNVQKLVWQKQNFPLSKMSYLELKNLSVQKAASRNLDQMQTNRKPVLITFSLNKALKTFYISIT
jgi:hypothetical protein